MEVTRQLLTERAGKKGLARIQLTFCWSGQRLRLSSGQKCLPKDWDDKRERMKAKPNTYAEAINLVIDRYTDAATGAWHAATLAGRDLNKAEMKTEIERRVAELAASGASSSVQAPTLQAVPLTFLDQLQRWVDEVVATKISNTTGRRLTDKTVGHHRRLARDLAAFSQARPLPLTFEGMDQAFYAALRGFLLGELQYAPHTFNNYVKMLRGFLTWADYEGLPVYRRFREVFKRIEAKTWIDALTQDELLAVAGIDFASPAVQAYVAEHFPTPASTGRRAPLTTAEHARRLAHTRDKFLLCAYTALRIGDANRLGPQHLHGEVARIEAHKTGVTCIIPLLDDDVFKPAALLARYAPLGLPTCLPYVHYIYTYLPHVQHLAGITRLKLGMHIGRKTFATLKIYQGVPRSQVMLATGHQTEASFNAYLGIDEGEFLDAYRKTARRVAEKGGTLLKDVA